MALDEKLNRRIREVLAGKKGIKEQKMFGGLCFMHHGHMMCGADQKHGLSVRVGPDQYEKVLKLKHARKMDITGVPLKGLVFVNEEGYKTKANLAKWIDRGMSFTQSLPKKGAKSTKKPASSLFTKEVFTFFKELEQNNSKEWFHENKARYEAVVKEPMLQFLSELSSKLGKDYEVTPKAILRQHRDIRFSKDKSPYKTYVACFLHKKGMKKSDHPHGYYLQIGASGQFFGAGVYAPSSDKLLKIRKRIVAKPKEWKKVQSLPLEGEKLKKSPRGFDPDHIFVEDLKRKDLITSTKITKKDVTSKDLPKHFLKFCQKTKPLMDFLMKC